MSGFKRATVTINEQEYRRLHEAEMKRRFRGPARTRAKEHRPGPQLESTLQQVEDRHRQLAESLGSLDDRLDHLGAETREDILRQNVLLHERLSALIQESASDSEISLEMLSQRFAEEMQRERAHYRQHLQSLAARLERANRAEVGRADSARRWLRQSVTLAEVIQSQFDHERFAPGQLSRILASLDMAQGNLAQGFLESSLQSSQQAFLQLSELQLELEQRVVQWQAEYESTRMAIEDVIAAVEADARVGGLGLDGEQLAEQVDLGYWTNGKYDRLLEKSRTFPGLLEEDRQRVTTEELRHIREGLRQQVTSSLEELIYEARLNALNSQLRMNIAETALDALEQHGFRLNESGYSDKDMRAPFVLELQGADGSSVVIRVSPAEGAAEKLASELVVITRHPYLKTEQEARVQWQALCRSLQQHDLDVSRPEIRAIPPVGLPDPAPGSGLPTQQSIGSPRQHNV